MNCPTCGSPLARRQTGDNPLEECPRCGGAWLDVATFEKLTTDPARQSALLAVLRSHPAAPAPAGAPLLPCPRCARTMVRFDYVNASGIVLDACRAHGVWFEPDELRRVVEFIRAGGLHRRRDRHRDEPSAPAKGDAMDWNSCFPDVIDLILSVF